MTVYKKRQRSKSARVLDANCVPATCSSITSPQCVVDLVEVDCHVTVRCWKSHGAKDLALLGAQGADLLRLVDVDLVHVEGLPEHLAAVLVEDVDAVVQARLSPTHSCRLMRVEARHLVHLDTTLQNKGPLQSKRHSMGHYGVNNGHSYLLFFPAQPQVVVTSALRESGRLRLLVGRVVLEIVDLRHATL